MIQISEEDFELIKSYILKDPPTVCNRHPHYEERGMPFRVNRNCIACNYRIKRLKAVEVITKVTLST